MCKGRYHDFTNSYDSSEINLEHLNTGINKVNLEKMRKILSEMKSAIIGEKLSFRLVN